MLSYWFFLPTAINLPSQIQAESLVSGIGIDKSDTGTELELSVQITIPQQSTSYSPRSIVASGKGESLIDAIYNIELKVGQKLGLAHCFIIILGDEICSEDVPNLLDVLMRSNIMGNNSAIVHTSGKAKKLLEASSQLSEGDVNNIQNIAKYNKENRSSYSSSLIEFFNDYMSETPFSVVNSVDVEENTDSSSSSGSSDSGSSSGGSSGGSSTGAATNNSSSEILKNEGNVIIFKKGKKLLTLNEDEISKFTWLDSKAQRGIVTIENFSSNLLNDVNITLSQSSKILDLKASIVNNIPILIANIMLETKIEVITSEQGHLYTTQENYYDSAFLEAVQSKIRRDIADALELSKSNNFDILQIYNTFNISNHTEWKKFLSTLENPENYIEKVEIQANISLRNQP